MLTDCIVSDMDRAVSGSLINLPKRLEYGCSTGNCTYTDFVSLGVCHTCEDVSSISPTCLQRQREYNQDNTSSTSVCARLKYDTPHNITFIIENGTYNRPFNMSREKNYTIIQSHTLAPEELVPYIPKDDVVWAAQGTRNPRIPNKVPDYTTPALLRFAVAQPVPISDVKYQGNDKFPSTETSMQMTECQLNWCAKVYEKVHVVRIQCLSARWLANR